jgi:hypothetical protein
MKSFTFRVLLVLSLITSLVLFASIPPAFAAVTAAQSGIWGGGFINVISRNLGQNTGFAIGGDTSGFHTTTNAGDLWTTSNSGLNDPAQDTIAAIAYRKSPNNAQVYAAYGVGFAANSGILRSVNSGASWTKLVPVTGSPVFQGHTPGGAAAYQVGQAPRATGSLLALDESTGPLSHIYAGTFGGGVIRSEDGVNWTTIALGSESQNGHCLFDNGLGNTFHGCFITSVQLSPIPGETNTLYVTVHGGDATKCLGDLICGGVFKITNANCTTGDGCADATTTRMSAIVGPTPTNGEELTFVGTTLFCACGTDGFYKKSTADTGLRQANGILAFDVGKGTSYAAIVAKPSGGLIILGAYNAKCETVMGRESCHTLYKSTDASTWTDIAYQIPLVNIDTNVAGTNNIPWWEGTMRPNLIDGSQFNVASLALTNAANPVVMVAGHSGVWKSTNTDSMHWRIAVQAVGATVNNDVVADPTNAGYFYVGNTDWTVFASALNMTGGNVVQTETPLTTPKKTTGFALVTDKQDTQTGAPLDVYVAAGRPDPTPVDENVGDVYLNTNPVTQPWSSEGFVANCADGRTTPRVIGVTVGRTQPPPTGTPVLFAATDGCGLYKFDGTTWAPVTMGGFGVEDSNFDFAPFSWPNNLGQVLYVLDRKGGTLWRSENAGATWASIFTLPISAGTGFMVADPNATNPFIVWVTTNDAQGLYKLTCSTGCQTAANWTVGQTLTVPNPGPVALQPCIAPCITPNVYVATRTVVGDTTPPRLYKRASGGSSWCNLTQNVPFYAGSANFPVQLAVSPAVSGTVTALVTTAGEGTILVSDDSTCP